jgi:type IV secretory pathway TrbL component
MKKKTALIIAILLVLVIGIAYATVSPSHGQVSCGSSSATRINTAGDYRTLVIQNQTLGANVYIGLDSSITAANAGILLSSATGMGYIAETGNASWWCITSSGTGTVGWQAR